MKKVIAFFCCIAFLYPKTNLQAQSLDFQNAVYYTASGNSLTSSGQTLAAFDYSSASPAHPLLNDGVYFPAFDYLGHNLWVRVRHIADDPNGTSVGHNVTATVSSPFRDNGFGGWFGFLYQFDVYRDANLTGTNSNTLGGLYPTNITVESIETLSDPEWVSFEILNTESSAWTLNSVNFTGNNPGSNPGFSAVNIPYWQTTGFSNTFPASSKNIYAVDNHGSSYAEFRMSASGISQFKYGYEYFHAGGYQGFRLSFGSGAISAPSQKPGSGTALTFHGGYDAVDLGTAFSDQNFTVDMWLKPGVNQVGYTDIIDNNHTPTTNWVIQQNGNNTNEYYGFVSGTFTGSFTLVPEVWQHLVFVKSATELLIYINGMLINTTPWSGVVNYSSNFLRLGRYGGGGLNWNGSMDELRIWNTALSQSQIRDRMCHKIVPSDPLYSSLAAYYNFDEGTGTTLVDSKSGVNGFINGPTWGTSGAAVGNFSANNYSGAASSATLIHPTRGDALTATLTTGNADGIHVYNVTEAPNTLNGVTGAGGNNAYFGVFVVNGTSPTYNAVYNYANAFPGTNENYLNLYRRDDNAATIWSDCNATRDISANTLTTTGQHTEYMIGSTGAVLPVSGLNVEAAKEANRVKLNWSTLTETNSSFFEIERSTNGVDFTAIGTVGASGNSTVRKEYAYVDAVPERGMNYYRLKLVDRDGRFIYSAVRSVKFGDNASIVYPNPVRRGQNLQINFLTDGFNRVEILNTAGQVVYRINNNALGTLTVPVPSSWSAGQYIIKLTSASGVEVKKVLMQ